MKVPCFHNLTRVIYFQHRGHHHAHATASLSYATASKASLGEALPNSMLPSSNISVSNEMSGERPNDQEANDVCPPPTPPTLSPYPLMAPATTLLLRSSFHALGVLPESSPESVLEDLVSADRYRLLGMKRVCQSMLRLSAGSCLQV